MNQKCCCVRKDKMLLIIIPDYTVSLPFFPTGIIVFCYNPLFSLIFNAILIDGVACVARGNSEYEYLSIILKVNC